MNEQNIQTALRLEGIGEYYFSTKLREIDMLRQSGKNIINLGIGSPDMPPHPAVIEALQKSSLQETVHGYQPYKGSPVLRGAICNWYKRWFGVEPNINEEILPLIGSKEGLMHICMAYLNEGDIALTPNPGYPTYAAAVRLSGGVAMPFDLVEENNYSPDFLQLESLVATAKSEGRNVKLLFINYPHMPTGATPQDGLLADIVAFAVRHKMIVVYDNPYCFILNKTPQSILAVQGAKECCIELNSLSKSHNMAGWRLGFMVSKKEIIDNVLRFKSNMDSGMFLPLQLAAAKALELEADWFETINAEYALRKQKALEILSLLNCSYSLQQAGMFVWGKIPSKYTDGYELSDRILFHADVFITPGGIFGTNGNNYIRISLCSKLEQLQEAISRIDKLVNE